MKRLQSDRTSANGFTMIEIIVTIVVMGILAAFFIHFMGTAIDQSSKSMELVSGEAEAEGILEQIIAYYTSEINRNPAGTLSLLETKRENNYFGSKEFISMYYISFDEASGDEQTEESSDYLKVTVQVGAEGENTGPSLTTILTRSRSASTDPAVFF